MWLCIGNMVLSGWKSWCFGPKVTKLQILLLFLKKMTNQLYGELKGLVDSIRSETIMISSNFRFSIYAWHEWVYMVLSLIPNSIQTWERHQKVFLWHILLASTWSYKSKFGEDEKKDKSTRNFIKRFIKKVEKCLIQFLIT